MKTQPASPQSGHRLPPHPLWMRLLAMFSMALLTVAGTVQVCHTHDDLLVPGTAATACHIVSHSAAQPATPSAPRQDTNSAVNCPLCVAMHAALPVTHSLAHVETLVATPQTGHRETPKRLLPWRFQLASRPPPASTLA